MTDMTELAERVSTVEVYPPVLGVDPGAAHTGIALRVGTAAVEAVTVEPEGDPGRHTALVANGRRVLKIGHELISRNRDRLNVEARGRGLTDPPRVRVAVETLVPPAPVKRTKGSRVAVAPRILSDLSGAAAVLGIVSEHWRAAIPVPPRGRPGWDAVEGAPKNLHGRTPKGWLIPQPGTQQRNHQVSAWAIAGAAHVLAASPIRDQVRAAVPVIAAEHPAHDPETLVAAMRTGIAQTGTWDLLARLPDLAAATVGGLTEGDQEAAEQARQAVHTYLGQACGQS